MATFLFVLMYVLRRCIHSFRDNKGTAKKRSTFRLKEFKLMTWNRYAKIHPPSTLCTGGSIMVSVKATLKVRRFLLSIVKKRLSQLSKAIIIHLNCTLRPYTFIKKNPFLCKVAPRTPLVAFSKRAPALPDSRS